MSEDTTPQKQPGQSLDRIAKVMARAGIASRRDAERMILDGRVTVNGAKIDSPALDVLPTDRITVDGKQLDDPQETRLWLYYKPIGLVTSESDEKGRQTVFDALPRDLPRVMTIGRLDLTSEGLLLLTNDGELKRRLELPSTGWLRRYRVRVNGTPSDMTFAPLRRGVTIDGEEFAPMEVKLDSQQGANAWLTIGIREGKNREIRRAMSHIGLQVNRLIRIGYGPFKLTGIEKNQVIEVKRRVLRDQLGGLLTGDEAPKDREIRPRGAEGKRGPQGPRHEDGDGFRRPPRAYATGGESRFARKPAGSRDEAGRTGSDKPARSWAAKGDKPRSGGGDERGDRPQFRGRASAGQDDGTRPARNRAGEPRENGKAPGDRPRFSKPAQEGQKEGFRHGGGKPGYRSRSADKPQDERNFKPREDRPEGERQFKPRSPASSTDQGFKPRDRAQPGENRGFKPNRDAKPDGERGFKPRGDGKPGTDRKSFGKPGGPKPARSDAGTRFGDKPRGRPAGKPGDKPKGKPRG